MLTHLSLVSSADYNKHDGEASRNTVLVDLLVHLGRERNCAHDAVAKLLVYDALEGVAVVLDDLVEAVDQGLDGRHGPSPAPVREAAHRRLEDLLAHSQDLRQLHDILAGRLRLAVEQRGDGNLAASELIGDLLERQLVGSLGIEESLRVGGQPVCEA